MPILFVFLQRETFKNVVIMENNLLSLLDADVLNGFFVCASIALLCIGFAILISSLKN